MNIRIIASILFIFTICAEGGEYRFSCMGVVTGLCDAIYDNDGKEVMVKLNFSDRESAVIFHALQKKRIYGTKGLEDHEGIKWQQDVFLVGELSSEVKRTQGGANTPGTEEYREFRVSGIKLAFPVWRFQECEGEDPSARPVFLEAHFVFESLFPQGLMHEGKQIDWRKHIRANDRK